MKYGFIREHQREYPISTMCRVLERLRPDQLYRLPRPRDVGPDLLKLLERAASAPDLGRPSSGSGRSGGADADRLPPEYVRILMLSTLFGPI